MKLIIDIPEDKYEWLKKNNPNADTNSVVGAIANGIPYDERPQDDDLCETCRYGDTCDQSDKGVSFAKHSKCWKYEKREADNDDKGMAK